MITMKPDDFFYFKLNHQFDYGQLRRVGERPLIKFVEIATITLTISVRPCLMVLNDGEGRKLLYFSRLCGGWVYSCVHFFFILVFSASAISVLAHSFLFYVSVLFCSVNLRFLFCFYAYISYLRAPEDEKQKISVFLAYHPEN